MSVMFDHPDFDNHEQVVYGSDAEAGLRAIIAVHNTTRGPALGGCRMYPYPDEAAALKDVLRLSRGMTYKSAMADLPLGGGKAVIIGDPRRHKTPALLQAMGRLVDALDGRYITAEDSGTAVPDLRYMAEVTPHVTGIRERAGLTGDTSDGDPSPATAYGVFLGLKAAVEYRLARTDLDGLRVAVQGLGNVGWRLAQSLRDAGARLWVTDVNPEVLARAERELGATVVDHREVFGLDVDVFAPCAMGGVINARTVEQLKAPVVAGAANNQLERPEFGEVLRRRGVLIAPDYVINAGGVIYVAYEREPVEDPQRVRAHIERIAQTLTAVFERSEREAVATQVVADRIAEERFQRRQGILAA